MSGLVGDASVALAWCFPDEASEYADAVLLALENRELIVPASWAAEIANGLWVGERRKRIHRQDVRQFTDLLKDLKIVQDTQAISEALTNVVPLAREYDISAYDAAYLDVALRHNAPLATLDPALKKAARGAGVTIVDV